MPATLTDRTNHQTLVEFPELLEDGNVGLVNEKDGHEGRQRVVQEGTRPALEGTLAHSQEEVVWDPADRVVHQCADLSVEPPIRELEKELENLRGSPHVKVGLRGVSRDGYICHRKPSKLARISTEVERSVIGGDVAPDCVHAHCILEGRRGPLPFK